MTLWKKEVIFAIVSIGLITTLVYLLLWSSVSQSPSQQISDLRSEQAVNDKIIQYMKPLIFNSCTKYKQSQINNINLEAKITVIKNSDYSKSTPPMKDKAMDTSSFCKSFVDRMSYQDWSFMSDLEMSKNLSWVNDDLKKLEDLSDLQN